MPVPETAPILAAGPRGAGLSEDSTRQREGREEILAATSTPTSPPKVKENQGTENCGWCPLVGLEDALLEAPGTEVEGKGEEDLHQNNWERPSARLAAPPPSCPPWSSRGSLGQL